MGLGWRGRILRPQYSLGPEILWWLCWPSGAPMTDLITRLEDAAEGWRLRKRIVVAENGCWNWQGGLDKHKRGRIAVNGRTRLAHREVWRFFHGPIQNGKLLCHHCDNPQCVNPDHLYVGTQRDNMRDFMERNTHWTEKDPERARKVGRESGLKNDWHRGEGNPKANLTVQQVERIRQDPRATRFVAADYGVDRTTIQRIRRGALWPLHSCLEG